MTDQSQDQKHIPSLPPLTSEKAGKASPTALAVDLQTVFLGGLFVLGLLAACNIAAAIILPIVLAFVLKLVLQPVMRTLQKMHVPRTLAAFLLITVLCGVFIGLGTALSVPASTWAHELPAEIPKLQQRINFMRAPMKPIQKVLSGAQQGLTGPPDPKTVTVVAEGSGFSDKLIAGTKNFASGLFEMMVVLFFMLISGDTFLRRLVEVLPRFADKKQAINISHQIEHDISAYLTTITMMNAVVGVATALVMFLCHVADPILWGIAAFLLNYIPIVGPMVALLLFAGVGLLSDGGMVAALTPAGLYFAVHLIEGEGVTPMLLARRFTLNPVLVILALVFWYWMWGIPGAILSTPMLAITKIICDRIHALKPFGHFIEG